MEGITLNLFFMEILTSAQNTSSNTVSSTARRNYDTYLKHYQLRNLKPISLEEFLRNYEL